MQPHDLRRYIRDIPDFPQPGVTFRDITTVLLEPLAWRATVDRMCEAVTDWRPDVVVGVESRGFILGATMAYRLGLGFVPVRKPGKLPAEVHSVDYSLEYGDDSLEIHTDAIGPGHRVVIVDDLIATGGSAAAAAELVGRCGGTTAGFAFLVELADLGGRAALPAGVPVSALLTY